MIRQFKHFKGGIYTFIADASSSVDNSSVVVYKDSKGKVWTRPAEEFYGDVGDQNSLTRQRRFVEIPESESNNYADVKIHDDDGNLIGTTRVFLLAD